MLDADLLRILTSRIRFVQALEVIDHVASTQDEARNRADQGAPQGSVVIAGSQEAGRGSRGRHWHSAEGTGLYMSLILRPHGSPSNYPRWTLLAAASVCLAFREAGVEAQIKWPNDIEINHRKLACALYIANSTRMSC